MFTKQWLILIQTSYSSRPETKIRGHRENTRVTRTSEWQETRTRRWPAITRETHRISTFLDNERVRQTRAGLATVPFELPRFCIRKRNITVWSGWAVAWRNTRRPRKKRAYSWIGVGGEKEAVVVGRSDCVTGKLRIVRWEKGSEKIWPAACWRSCFCSGIENLANKERERER